MKESLAITLAGLQGLGSTDDNRERPVDRLGALAMAQGHIGERASQDAALACLGGCVVGFKWSNRGDLRGDVEDHLAATLGWPRWSLNLSPKNRMRVSRWAVIEYVLPFCLTCRGAKEIPNFNDVDGRQPMKCCPTCNGVGSRLYTDEERADAMGHKYPEAMSISHHILSRAEALAVRGAARMLERW